MKVKYDYKVKIKHNFARNLRKLRENSDLTLCELASKLGCKDYTLSKYEAGLHEPRIQGVLQVAKYFKVDVNDLITGRVHGE